MGPIPIFLWMLRHKSKSLSLVWTLYSEVDWRSIAYAISADDGFAEAQGAFFPLLEDQLSVGQDMGQALDPAWQALSLPGDLTSIMPPFSNLNYLG
jgi:hypothetical protein